MKNLTDEDLKKMYVGSGNCGKAIVLGVVFGSLFGGGGSVSGGLVAANINTPYKIYIKTLSWLVLIGAICIKEFESLVFNELKNLFLFSSL